MAINSNLNGGNGLRTEHEEVKTPDVLQPRAVVDDEEHRLEADLPLRSI